MILIIKSDDMLDYYYLQSWLITYLNLMLTAGTIVIAMVFAALTTAKLLRFIEAEHRRYQPYAITVFLKELIKSNTFLDVIIKLIFPQPLSQFTKMENKMEDLMSNGKMLFSKIEEVIDKFQSPPRKEALPPHSEILDAMSKTDIANPVVVTEAKPVDIPKSNEIINSIIKSSLDISNLDNETKHKLSDSLIVLIHNLHYINGQITLNNTELTGILDRIAYNIYSTLFVSSGKKPDLKEWLQENPNFLETICKKYCDIQCIENSDLPIEATFDVLSCMLNKTNKNCHKTCC